MINMMFYGPKIPYSIPRDYPEVLLYNGHFYYKDWWKNFFDELEFPIFEFLLYFHGWKSNESNDFIYNSLETEDNPLISLRIKGGIGIYILRGNYFIVIGLF